MNNSLKNSPKNSSERRIDLNADLGERFGVYTLGSDLTLLRLVTSANIACGFHAGDPHVMAQTVAAAAAHGVALGAHPGLPDLVGFGRRPMAVTPGEVRDLITYQIGALAAFAARQGQTLQHVKPHGALYHMAEEDTQIAAAIAEAVSEWDTNLVLVGRSGGRLCMAGQARGLRVAAELFADRAYSPDGTLAPRSQPGAVLHDLGEIAARMMRWAKDGVISATDGTWLTLPADTICLHGDTPHASDIAACVRRVLEAEGVTLKSMSLP